MIKGILIIILGMLCCGCVSSKAQVSSIKVQKPIKRDMSEKGCQMMANGYLVCPKAVRS